MSGDLWISLYDGRLHFMLIIVNSSMFYITVHILKKWESNNKKGGVESQQISS